MNAVESDYTVVFLAAGNRNTPGWNWVWKAYRSLSRKYRKNLKRLVRIPSHLHLQRRTNRSMSLKYVVHSNFFTKSACDISVSHSPPLRLLQCSSLWLERSSGVLGKFLMLTEVDGPSHSPKFFRKITYINTLSELAYHVPITQIDIPPAVYQ